MRYAVLALAAAVMLAAPVRAQTTEWADKLFTKDGTSHNFGNVPRGAVLSHRFTLTNIYAVPLTITETRPSCGCVTVTPSAKIVQPKESIYLDISMDARRFTGPKTVTIFVTVGPQYTSTATLQVQANSRGDIVFNPGQINFGVVAAGQTPTQTVDIEYAGNLDWKVTGIAEHSAPLAVKAEELYRQPGQVIKVGYRLTATLNAGAPPGAGRWEFLLQTNDPASPTVPVLVEATVQATLTVAPGQVKLPDGKVGEEASFNVVISGSKPFKILAVEGQGDGLIVEGPTDARAKHIVRIKWQPGQAGDFRRELRFKTDLDGATAVVPVEGSAAAP